MKIPRLVVAVTGLGWTACYADLVPYAQNFESLDIMSETALEDDEWFVFANVFSADFSEVCYDYGTFVAPNLNPGVGFSNVVSGEGGEAQGVQSMVVYSDYNNGDQADRPDAEPEPLPNKQIEANVFQEWTVGEADVGNTWVFEFDAKLGNLVEPSTAFAFIKTLDPGAEFGTVDFLKLETTALPITWGTYSISITIEEGHVGFLLQIGFSATATLYNGSGVVYDNIRFTSDSAPDPSRIEIISFDRTGTIVRIDFVSKDGTSYDLQKLLTEETGWQVVDSFVASGPMEFLQDTAATESGALYRVVEAPM